MFRSTDAGTSWIPLNTGLGSLSIDVLEVGGQQLYAGVAGLGVWKRPLSEITVEVEEEDDLPMSFALYQNYPNPFNPSTVIGFDIPVQSQVRLRVYDILGQEVVQLVDGQKSARRFVVEWNGANSSGGRVTSGLYFYTMQAQPASGGEGFVTTKKMLLLK